MSDARSAAEQLIAEGHRLEDAGRVEEAVRAYGEAARLDPQSARPLINLGNALTLLGRIPEAESRYRQAASLDRASAPAHFNLGNALMALGRNAEAAQAYREALVQRPEWGEAWTALGAALEEGGDSEGSIVAYRNALQRDAGHAGAAFNLSGLLERTGRAGEAKVVLTTALARHPDHPALLTALGNLHRLLAEHEEAARLFRRVIDAYPDDRGTWSNLLLTLNFTPDVTAEALLAEHRRFGQHLTASVSAPARPPLRAGAERLRIGYLSADFRAHSVACFFLPLLEHHDPARVEVFCYYNGAGQDAVTRSIEARAPLRRVAGLPPDEVARRISQDRVDILVDLGGHTANNSLDVLARRPAPVQCTWLGYLCTTGLEAIDYRICDGRTDPEGVAEGWHVEKLARLPAAQWCFRPLQAPAPTPLPRLARGYWTFGSFNQFGKLNDPLLRAWARVLAAVPGSRLRIAGVARDLGVARVREVLAREGVGPDRLEIVLRLPLAQYLAGYGEVDVALDSFPGTGGTTTCDALLAGVPVATVAGSRSWSRSGASLLAAVGLEDWIAPSLEDLPQLIARHTASEERIAELRRALPARMRASPLMDAPAFAREMEALYRRMWDEVSRRAP